MAPPKKLLSTVTIQKQVRTLARQVSKDYQNKNLVIVCILKGAVVFLADLIRNINLPLQMDFIEVSSYGQSAQSSGKIKIKKGLDLDLKGKDVLLVEDIIETGWTLDFLIRNFKQMHPRSLKLCVLLDKPGLRKVKVKIDYKGFEIPDKFVVGYGLDLAEKYRNLPYLAYL